MRLLVTGAAGMLGQDVVGVARSAGHDVLPMTRSDLDVTDEVGTSRTLGGLAPDAVINCAAWTDVDGAEGDPEGAAAVNAGGAGHVAAACAAAGAALVHVSTDYVFDGRSEEPYVESDEVGALSVYGQTKLDGERAVAAAGPAHAIVRSSWLFGTGGGNFVETMLGLAGERDSLSVVTDQVGCPTWTGHLAEALIAVAEQALRGVIHAAGGGEASWHELAVEAFEQAGIDVPVRAITTADMPRPAPRPAHSVLVSERSDAPRLPDWREGVRSYLAARARAGAAA